MMVFIILIKLSSNQFLYLLSLQRGWGAFVSPSVLAVLELMQGPCHHKNSTTAYPELRPSQAACGIDRAVIRKWRVTMRVAGME